MRGRKQERTRAGAKARGGACFLDRGGAVLGRFPPCYSLGEAPRIACRGCYEGVSRSKRAFAPNLANAPPPRASSLRQRFSRSGIFLYIWHPVTSAIQTGPPDRRPDI